MLLKRTYCNSDQERNDKYDIQELIRFERYCRDHWLWDEMHNCYADDSFVDISWYQGNGHGFVNASAKMQMFAPHKMHNIMTWVNGEKAVTIAPAVMEVRMTLNGVACELHSDVRLIFRTKKIDGQWLIVGFESIYDKDSIVPLLPNTQLNIPAEELNEFRPSYACMAYMNKTMGRTISMDQPGRDRPESIEKLLGDLEDWLYVSDEGGGV